MAWITRTINKDGTNISFEVNTKLKKLFHLCCVKNGATFSEVLRDRIEKYARETLDSKIIEGIERESE
jgi:plasmid replication initiation protein